MVLLKQKADGKENDMGSCSRRGVYREEFLPVNSGKEITNQSIENIKLREMALSDNIIVSIERVNV